MAEIRNNDFTQGSMSGNILQMSVPLAAANVINVLYSVVDRVYIGHMAEVGSMALTGIGVAAPIITIVTAFAALCGSGGAPLCSIARGRGDTDEAERIMGNSFSLLLLLAVLLTFFVQLFLEPMLYLFGGSESTLVYALPYARIYIGGTIFVMISLGMNYFINSQGFAKIGMLTIVLGAIVNIVLDPVFIFAFQMGVRGAAYATVMAQCCSAVWAMAFILGPKSILKLRLSNLRLSRKLCGRILSLGLTGFVAQATNGLVQICINSQLKFYGGDIYVGAMTVVNSIREIVFTMIHSLTQGCQPVLGYNYGAGRNDRVKEGIRFVTKAGLIYCLVCCLLIMAFPGALVRIFNSSDPEMVRLAVSAMRIYLCGLAFMGFQAAGQSIFVGLGKTKRAVFFSLLRKVIIVLPLIYLLPRIPLFGVNGIYWSEPISDVLGGLACYLTMVFTLYKKL